jgi:hypothetical protein
LELYCRPARHKDKRINMLLLGCGLVMDCQTAIEYINLYADDMLNKKETESLLSHIGSCSKCKKDLDDVIAVKKALAGLNEIEPPDGLALSALKKAKKRRIHVFAYASAGIAAVIALAAVFSSGMFNNNYAPEERAAQPAAYSQDLAGQAEMQEASASEAPMCAPSAAPDSLYDGNNAASNEVRKASVPFINVPADVSESFREALIALLSENNIGYKCHTAGNIDTISFKINEDKLDDLNLLIEKSFPYEEKLDAGPVEFIFGK